jgi:membrane protease YdiL (CAAX protease family)
MKPKMVYWNEILIYAVLSISLTFFYALWSDPIIGLIIGLLLFFSILNVRQLNFFKSLSQFRPRYIRYLLPVLLEWLIALPIQFVVLGTVNLDAISNAGSKALLNIFFLQLFLIIREEIATSFCWLMLAFLVMRLLKVKELYKSNLKFVLVVMAIFFAIGHLPNVVATAKYPSFNMPERILGATFIFLNAFIFGLFIKTIYIKTRSIQTCVAVHFFVNLRRVFFPMMGQQFDLLTFDMIGYEALILIIYIIATCVLWREEWHLERLNEVYAALDAMPLK